jgi:hypothetical protein
VHPAVLFSLAMQEVFSILSSFILVSEYIYLFNVIIFVKWIFKDLFAQQINSIIPCKNKLFANIFMSIHIILLFSFFIS